MRVRMTSFWLQKPGNRPSEYEDAFYPFRNGLYRSRRTMRFAIADGASYGPMSKAWADILVRWYHKSRARRLRPPHFLRIAYRRWTTYLDKYATDSKGEAREIPWYLHEGLRIGGFSTLLGLTLLSERGRSGGEWQAVAVGDSCLFCVRANRLITSFPLQSPGDFDQTPVLIASDSTRNGMVAEALERDAGEWRAGDLIFLMTDALAAWFLGEYAEGRQPWRPLADLRGGSRPGPFDELVRDLQGSQRMRGDDATLVRLDIL